MVDVRWSAPSACPDRAGFVGAIEGLVGHRLRLSAEAGVAIDGQVLPTAEGHALRLELRSPRSLVVRELEGPRCDELMRAGAIVVVAQLSSPDFASAPESALEPVRLPSPAVGPASGEPQPSDEDAGRELARPISTAVRGAERVPPPPPPPERAPGSTDARYRPRGAAFIMGGGEFGATPRGTGAIRGGVALRWPWARAELRAHHAFTRSTPGTDGLRVRASLTRGELVGCGVFARGSIDLPLCAGVALGAAIGTASGPVLTSRTRTQLWWGLPVEAGIGWAPLDWLALRATLGGAVSLRRPAFHVQAARGPVEPYRLPAVSGLALGGLEVRLP
ncbi:MAG: hypothetical protein AAGF11_07945 [Myxococcota bacterium]